MISCFLLDDQGLQRRVVTAQDTLPEAALWIDLLEPAPDEEAQVEQFLAAHELIFVIEQNRDAQMSRLLINETSLPSKQKLVPVLNFDGLPITARHIANVIRNTFNSSNVTDISGKREAARKAKA